jgi:hypothetical protein
MAARLRVTWMLPWLTGCSLLVGGAPEPMACSEEGRAGPPACDPGFICRANVCVADAGTDGAGGGIETSAGAAGEASGGAAGEASGGAAP